MSVKRLAILCALVAVLFLAASHTAVVRQTSGPMPGWYNADIRNVGNPFEERYGRRP